ncbi:MAG: tRNA (adenosine(37)-N6)-threonylcarbamoyltransferase complex ATPase subunit type 1 TsaE [Rhodothermales bacterium]
MNALPFPTRTRSAASDSASDTRALGAAFAVLLEPGDVVALEGDLGAGKTQFVAGVVEGLGGDAGDVSSPTFTIAHEYEARIPVYHIDLYRLEDEADARRAGLEDYFLGDGICLVEWPERARGLLPEGTHVVRIAHASGDHRTLTWLEDGADPDAP